MYPNDGQAPTSAHVHPLKKSEPVIAKFRILTLLLSAALPIAPAQTKADAEGQYERGEKLFSTYCVRCHGKNADGEGRMVKRLYRKLKTQLPSNFTLGIYSDRPAEYLHKIITNGGENHSMSKYMPPFGEELSAKNIDDLVHFIRKTPEKYAIDP
ncbi:MAG TPA: cytochrome c [Chromatiales bacterium]|nr:cytochrome c [Chromatiales bacterium]HEX22255.1 cytochrome c [Chromatiales bacterium]